MKFQFLILFFLLSLNSAFASLVIEPYAGGTIQLSDTAEYYASYGGRVGWAIGSLELGGDYGLATVSYKSTLSSVEKTDKYSRTRIGGFLSFALDGGAANPSFIGSYVKNRIWASYIFSEKDKVTSSTGSYSAGQYFKGSGFELGYENRLFAIFSWYMAIRKTSLSTAVTSTGTTSTLTGDSIVDIREVEVGLGIPFSLF